MQYLTLMLHDDVHKKGRGSPRTFTRTNRKVFLNCSNVASCHIDKLTMISFSFLRCIINFLMYLEDHKEIVQQKLVPPK